MAHVQRFCAGSFRPNGAVNALTEVLAEGDEVGSNDLADEEMMPVEHSLNEQAAVKPMSSKQAAEPAVELKSSEQEAESMAEPESSRQAAEPAVDTSLGAEAEAADLIEPVQGGCLTSFWLHSWALMTMYKQYFVSQLYRGCLP